MSEAIVELRPGQRFRNLKIQSELGRGAMGIVYLASHEVLRVPVVVKIMSAEERDEALEEARLAARVVSPHVVAVLDAGTTKGQPYIVQRYVDGIDFEEVAQAVRTKALTVPGPLLCKMIADVARGLHLIHQSGVVHRDIKPANLFLSGTGEAAVGDFGVAFERADAGRDELAGTPYYMAPEQWEEGQDVDRRADLYALGATIHEMVTGRPPFEARSVRGLRKAHKDKAYRAPRADDPSLAYLLALARRMLRKDCDDRPPHAGAVARLLSAVACEDPPVVCRGMEARIGRLRVVIERGDLATTEADVLVSAAYRGLAMDTGVAAALAEAGGERLVREAQRQREVGIGDVVWTKAGQLEAKAVAHAVAAWQGAICLRRCTLRVLLGAERRRYSRIAFPALGTGAARVPMSLAATAMLEAVRTFAAFEPVFVREVRVVIHEEDDPQLLSPWLEVLRSMTP